VSNSEVKPRAHEVWIHKSTCGWKSAKPDPDFGEVEEEYTHYIEVTPAVKLAVENFEAVVKALDLVFFAYNQSCQLTDPNHVYELLEKTKCSINAESEG